MPNDNAKSATPTVNWVEVLKKRAADQAPPAKLDDPHTAKKPKTIYKPYYVGFRLRLRAMTDKAFGILFENSDDDEPLEWLPRSRVIISNHWRHNGEEYISGKMPEWLADRIGLVADEDDESDDD